MKSLDPAQLAFCSWSVKPGSPQELARRCGEIGINRVQLALRPLYANAETWGEAGEVLREAGVEIVSGMIGMRGEDYTSPQTIRETGGVVPDATWEDNWRDVQQAAEVASGLGLDTISTHAGFIPEDESDARFGRVVERIQQIADLFGRSFNGRILLETGQETADSLLRFLDAVDRENVGVNFDPANMLLYDMGEPIGAMTKLMYKVGQVHLKDATRPREPGQWGSEVRLGEGEVDWPAFLHVLADHNYEGAMVIEREAGDDRVGDIRYAADLIHDHLEATNTR